MKKILITCWLLLLFAGAKSQSNDTVTFQYVADVEFSWTYSAYTTLFDNADRPYVYAACMELGLVVFDISNISNPIAVDTFTTQDFGNHKVTNIYQDGNYLYASLGGFQGATQNAGLSILDLSDPANISIMDTWDSTAFNQGAAVVITAGNYAYLGAMERGMVILDISNQSNIQYVSHILPDPNWPQVPGLFSVPNARGMAYRNDTIYLCYDAGGMRLIDVTDKQNPVEAVQYINTALDNIAQPAYNNVVLVEDYAYIAVDYCGIDVVDISDPGNPQTANWINPWDCDSANWNGRPGHTNQLVTVKNDSILMVSGADTEVLAYDITDRANPELIGSWFTLNDSSVTWGLDANESHVVMAHVDNPFGVPYVSDYGGIQILEWDADFVTSAPAAFSSATYFSVYPNPVKGERFTLNLILDEPLDVELNLLNALGQQIHSFSNSRLPSGHHQLDIHLPEISRGIYFLEMNAVDEWRVVKLVKQ